MKLFQVVLYLVILSSGSFGSSINLESLNNSLKKMQCEDKNQNTIDTYKQKILIRKFTKNSNIIIYHPSFPLSPITNQDLI